MIIWHDNIVNTTLDFDKFVSEVRVDKYYDKILDVHTTYLKDGAPDMQLVPFYSTVIAQFMTELGIYHRSEYQFNLWTQVYSGNNISRHREHDHFASDVVLSWVHFLKPPEQDCFCFIDSNDNEIFPEVQKKNDFIVFPSWALHKAIPFTSDENRVIVAGNITLKQLHQKDREQTMVRDFNVLGNATTVYQTYYVPNEEPTQDITIEEV